VQYPVLDASVLVLEETTAPDNASGADNQQERLSDVERILRDYTPNSSGFLKG
jgi:hypothetical protein